MSDIFNHFTRRARQTLGLAQAEAERRNHNQIDPEHLLLGLLTADKGRGVAILERLGGNPTQIRNQVEGTIDRGQWSAGQSISLSQSARNVVEWAMAEARNLNHQYVGTEHLLLGLLAEKGLPQTVLGESGLTQTKVRRLLQLDGVQSTSSPEPFSPFDPAGPAPIQQGFPFTLSPVFMLLLLLTVVAGYLTYQQLFAPRLMLFLFVIGGWLITLSLHEFGHALVAFFGGDHSVVGKGYLSLNPLKYTHVGLSIIFPLLFLAMGGIGLPGGAVYVNMGAIRSQGMRSLTSAAGPLATLVCAILLTFPFSIGLLGLETFSSHLEFWAGLALLAFLQITALFLNLLPIPGLDGFGILAPFLPDSVLRGAHALGGFTFLILFILFFNNTPVSRGFWLTVLYIGGFFNLDFRLVGEGLRLFQFWSG